MTEKDLKLLWSRSGSLCAFPGCRTSLSADPQNKALVIGEMAHIVGEKRASARWRSDLTDSERDSYFNRILLCPTHHTLVDKEPDTYTVERLHFMKDSHEEWVRERLGIAEKPEDLIYASVIDHATRACRLDRWNVWAGQASSPGLSWHMDLPDSLHDFRARTISAIWPGTLTELEKSLVHLSRTCYLAWMKFSEHAELTSDTPYFRGQRFYRGQTGNDFAAALDDFNHWVQESDQRIIEATKAANWFADVVRRDFNPMYFAVDGKFLLTLGPYEILTYNTYLFEYSDADKEAILSDAKPYNKWL